VKQVSIWSASGFDLGQSRPSPACVRTASGENAFGRRKVLLPDLPRPLQLTGLALSLHYYYYYFIIISISSAASQLAASSG
jgi:hypothetical protein